jgi:hypothetical protein
MITTDNPVPWHLIARQWKNGSSLDALSARFNVSIDQLKSKLATRYDSDRLDIRTNAQIKLIGEQVKSDLVTALARISQSLANQPDISLRDAPALDRLINSAARLFSWPSPKPFESQSTLTSGNTNAINLALIRTTPDQLKALSDERAMQVFRDGPADVQQSPFPASVDK